MGQNRMGRRALARSITLGQMLVLIKAEPSNVEMPRWTPQQWDVTGSLWTRKI